MPSQWAINAIIWYKSKRTKGEKMDIKTMIEKQLKRGFSKKIIADDFDTNTKMLNAILKSPSGAYTLIKTYRANKSMRSGTSYEECS